MKTALALLLVAVAYASAQRVCTPTELTFIFDYSEHASEAFTGDGQPRFNILVAAWQRVMSELMDNYSNVNIRIWAIGYSSTNRVLVNRQSSPAQAYNAPMNGIASGGSWTYQGLSVIADVRPTANMNNVVIIVSAGGTFNTQRRRLALESYQNMRNNGWVTRVIGVQTSSGSLDVTELNSITEQSIETITDGNQIGDKLSQLVQQAIVCQQITNPPRPVVTFPPVINRPTLPPTTGICSSCKKNEVDSHFYDSHAMCDGFYQCLPDRSYVEMSCGEGLWWDADKLICDYPKNVNCATASCGAGVSRRYPSHLCCNKYFYCNNGVVTYEKCPSGQMFDARTESCQGVANITASCTTHYCGERLVTEVNTCNDHFAPDTTGNPCQFYHDGVLMKTAAGTRWYQPNCTQVLVQPGTTCDVNVMDRALVQSADCSPLVISTFNANENAVYSQRVTDLDLYMLQLNVITMQNALVFNSNNPVAYYYFFANNELQANSALRIVFKLDSRVSNRVVYDLFSNNFCVQCPETIGATVSKTGGGAFEIVTRLTDSVSKSSVSTRTTVTTSQTDPWLDLRVIWGKSEVYGQVNILDGNKRFVRAVPIARVQHRGNANIAPNKCGLLLGAGANTVFQGMIDEFAYYTSCQNIDDVLQIQNSVIF